MWPHSLRLARLPTSGQVLVPFRSLSQSFLEVAQLLCYERHFLAGENHFPKAAEQVRLKPLWKTKGWIIVFRKKRYIITHSKKVFNFSWTWILSCISFTTWVLPYNSFMFFSRIFIEKMCTCVFAGMLMVTLSYRDNQNGHQCVGLYFIYIHKL